jgi:4'-phosphopantetheinyl transferase
MFYDGFDFIDIYLYDFSLDSDKIEIYEKILINYGLTFSNLVYEFDKKPYLVNSKLYISFSNKNNKILIAVSNTSIGVDIELNKSLSQNLINKILTIDEKKYDKHLYGDISSSIFFWTRKEAYSKFTGKGMSINFNTIDTTHIENFYHYIIDNYLITIYCTIVVKNISLYGNFKGIRAISI